MCNIAIKTKFFDIIKKQNLVADDTPINENTKILELGISSVSFIKMIVEIERNFEIEFDDTMLDIKNFQTLNDIIIYIEKQLENKTT